MTLFVKKDFIMHSGEKGDFKIECDALTDDDLETMAYLISKRFTFKKAHGIPRGGLRIAKKLKQYADPTDSRILVVDDVMTTGTSMQNELIKVREENPAAIINGVVLFNRSDKHKLLGNISPLYLSSILSLFTIW